MNVDIEKLQMYCDLEGTEIGCYVSQLISIRGYSSAHGMPGDFSTALNKELQFWLYRFEKESVVIEETLPQPDKIYRELVWKDEL